jgi:predicted transcriptional regulator
METQMMNVLKQASIETIKRLPNECTIDDIMYEINFVAQVYEGLKDADEGKLITIEELLKRVDQWVK